jgi:hypothetical protein
MNPLAFYRKTSRVVDDSSFSLLYSSDGTLTSGIIFPKGRQARRSRKTAVGAWEDTLWKWSATRISLSSVMFCLIYSAAQTPAVSIIPTFRLIKPLFVGQSTPPPKD